MLAELIMARNDDIHRWCMLYWVIIVTMGPNLEITTRFMCKLVVWITLGTHVGVCVCRGGGECVCVGGVCVWCRGSVCVCVWCRGECVCVCGVGKMYLGIFNGKALQLLASL